jgi:hypothetical protein
MIRTWYKGGIRIKVINPNKIKRLDIDMKEACCNSDGEPLVITGEYELSVIYNEGVISTEEVQKLIEETDNYKILKMNIDERVLIIPTKNANNFQSVFNPEVIHGVWCVFESDINQLKLDYSDRYKIKDYDAMRTFESESDAIAYQGDNIHHRERKYIRFTHEITGGDENG